MSGAAFEIHGNTRINERTSPPVSAWRSLGARAASRKACQDVMRDQEFWREAERAGLEISPVSGEEIDSAPAVARLRTILSP